MISASRRSGRISILLVAGIACVALFGLPFFFQGDSASGAAARFLSALARGDAKELAADSVIGDQSQAEVQKEWEKTLKASAYVPFQWTITRTEEGDETATVRIEFLITDGGGVPAKHELQLLKQNGMWKVDVTQIARDMYPFLPG